MANNWASWFAIFSDKICSDVFFAFIKSFSCSANFFDKRCSDAFFTFTNSFSFATSATNSFFAALLMVLRSSMVFYSSFNSFGVNRSEASLKKTGVPVLLNAVDSTRFYVGSYPRDVCLRSSRPLTLDHGRRFRRAKAAAIVHHHHRSARRLPQGVLGHPQC